MVTSTSLRRSTTLARTDTDRWDTVSFVISSRYRLLVVDHLAEAPATPSQIDADDHVLIEHVSRAIHELRDRNVVALLVPEDQQKGRLYGLTDRGERVVSHLQTTGLV
jgi:DNA-binding HxlR family transcriptional regulator